MWPHDVASSGEKMWYGSHNFHCTSLFVGFCDLLGWWIEAAMGLRITICTNEPTMWNITACSVIDS
jgi:hypothetical protein